MLLPIIHVKGGKWIIKLAFIVEYQTPSRENILVISFVPEQKDINKSTSFLCKFYDDRKQQGA